MYEENLVLSKIEELVEQLPYRSVKIEVELDNKTPHSYERPSASNRLFLCGKVMKKVTTIC